MPSPTKSSPQLHSYSWESYLSRFPNSPGVYFFVLNNNKILYIGKAKNLKSRVKSYKYSNLLEPRIKKMLSIASKVKYLICESEMQACLVEADLIKTHQPLYNSRLKDDKSEIYIVITSDSFPRIITSRKTDLIKYDERSKVFGPFKSAHLTKIILNTSRKLFPFCNQINKKTNKPCFYYHLKLCPGACIGKITKNKYLENIKYLSSFLKGKVNFVNESLRKNMDKYSHNKNYEKAAEYRDLINFINLSVSNQSYIQEISPTNIKKSSILKKLWKSLSPFFSSNIKSIPKKPFSRIEAYDVSNIKGKQATASMVVFTNGKKDKKEYRKFKIKYVKNYDDPLMLSEALYRRLKHREWKLPDLILVDGGKNQVKSAKKVLASFGLHHKIFLIGLAKREETVFVHKNIYHQLNFEKNSNELLLLMHIRDEAHRFAKKYHTYLRNIDLLS